MRRNRIFAAAIALFAFASVFPTPAGAQKIAQLSLAGSGIFSNPTDQIGKASKALGAYCQDNGKLPASAADLDKCLQYVYEKLHRTTPSAGEQPSAEGKFRRLGNLLIAIDPAIKNAPLDEWRKTPPSDWQAATNSVVILLSGEDTYLVWMAGIQKTPAKDQFGQAILLRGQCSKADGGK